MGSGRGGGRGRGRQGSGQRGKRALCAIRPSCSGSLEAGEPSKLAGEPQAGPHSGPVSLTPAPWCLLLHKGRDGHFRSL